MAAQVNASSLLANRYRILRPWGDCDAEGRDFMVTDTMLEGEPRAIIHFVPDEVLSDRSSFNRLRESVYAAFQLSHPNLVAVSAFEEDVERPFIVEGVPATRTLKQYLESEGALPKESADELSQDLRTALKAAHTSGIVHGQLDLNQIYVLDDGTPVMAGFGRVGIIHNASKEKDWMDLESICQGFCPPSDSGTEWVEPHEPSLVDASRPHSKRDSSLSDMQSARAAVASSGMARKTVPAAYCCLGCGRVFKADIAVGMSTVKCVRCGEGHGILGMEARLVQPLLVALIRMFFKFAGWILILGGVALGGLAIFGDFGRVFGALAPEPLVLACFGAGLFCLTTFYGINAGFQAVQWVLTLLVFLALFAYRRLGRNVGAECWLCSGLLFLLIQCSGFRRWAAVKFVYCQLKHVQQNTTGFWVCFIASIVLLVVAVLCYLGVISVVMFPQASSY